MVTNAPLKTIAPACRVRDSGVKRNAPPSSAGYIERTKCECMMPFGSPVVPLVYMMLNSVSGVTVAGTSVSGCVAASAW